MSQNQTSKKITAEAESTMTSVKIALEPAQESVRFGLARIHVSSPLSLLPFGRPARGEEGRFAKRSLRPDLASR